jgi:hypothetical protein
MKIGRGNRSTRRKPAIQRGPDGSLDYGTYTKLIHTSLRLSECKVTPPSVEQCVLSTLEHRAKPICKQDSLQAECDTLRTNFNENSNSMKQIWWDRSPS